MKHSRKCSETMSKRSFFIKANWEKSDHDLASKAKNEGVWQFNCPIARVLESVKAYRRSIRAFYVQDCADVSRDEALLFVDNCGDFEPYKSSRTELLFRVSLVLQRPFRN